MKQSKHSQQAAFDNQRPQQQFDNNSGNPSFNNGTSLQQSRKPKSRQKSLSPAATVSLEQQQLHKIVKLKKQSSLLDGNSAFMSTTSPIMPSDSDTLPQPSRQPHQQAKNMRISQQRILRESSIDSYLQQQVTEQQLNNKAQHAQSRANNLRQSQQKPRTHSSEPQDGTKLVKKVTMKGQTRGSNADSLSSVRQSSLTQRQGGSLLQSGPHTRSKSSAIGTDIVNQVQQNQTKASRKSNSRGRATPQGRASQLNTLTKDNQFKKVKKSTEQRSSLTITSPKDSTGDLNTSMPLPQSKSNAKALDKNQQQSHRAGRQQARPSGSTTNGSSQHATNSQATKVTGTPAVGTYQHTRKQSSTRHRSNSKKRGSINTSIRRQMEKSPATRVVTQPTKQSTVTKAHGYGASINWSKDQNHLLMDQQMAALAASAFSQQQNPTHQQSMHGQSVKLPITQLGKRSTTSVDDNQLFLAISSTLGNTQGHRLTPLVGSKSTRRQSNDRKNKSLASQQLDARSMEALVLKNNSSQEMVEPAQTLIGIDLQESEQQLQQIRSRGTKEHQMKTTKGGKATHHQQWSALPNQNMVNSQFSSFSKDPSNPLSLEAKHQSAQKVLRPKNSLIHSNAQKSESPNSHLRQTSKTKLSRAQAQVNHINESSTNSVYMQQNAQFMQLIRQSRQQPTQTQPAFNSRMSQNTIHQQSAISSAQSSRTVHDIYMQPSKKANVLSQNQMKSMSSRTMQSISSQQQTPYELNTAGGSQTVIQNTYGSTSAQQVNEGNELKGTFKDFRPRTQLGVSSQDSRSQQMLDQDVSGLSPEPRAEIILSKHQIQRANQSQANQSHLSFQKQGQQQSLQKLKFSQIQHANQSLQKDMAKKVVKSQRFMQDGKHAKSFSNSQPGGQNFLIFESKNLSALNANYLNAVQQPASNSVTHQEARTKEVSNQRQFAAKSASKVNQKHSNSMVQNWIYSADQSEESSVKALQTSLQNKSGSSFRQIGGLGHTTRQKFGKKPTFNSSEKVNHSERQSVPQFESQKQAQQPSYAIQIPSSKSQRSKNNIAKSVTGEISNNLYIPFNPPNSDQAPTTLSQRQIAQNGHQLSQQMVPQHLMSVQVQPNSNSSTDVVGLSNPLSGPLTASKSSKTKVLQGSRSQNKESILQAEQSHQKILGPTIAPQQLQTGKIQKASLKSSLIDDLNNHNAYANNAEDYFKKTPSGTKTPADKSKKKLKKGGVAKTSTSSSIVAGQSMSQQVSGKASPHVKSELGGIPETRLGIEQQNSQNIETRSALTAMGPPLSFVSQGSGQHQQTNQSHSGIQDDMKQVGMSRSRLTQFVVQSNMAKSTQQNPTFNVSMSVPSKTPNPSSHTSVKKTVLHQNQVKIINQHDVVKRSAGKQSTNKLDVQQKLNRREEVDDFQSTGKTTSMGPKKTTLTQSELMRKKNQAKMAGLSAQQQKSLKTKQNLIHEGSGRPTGTGTVLQKDPDMTMLSMSTNSRVQRASPTQLPNTIHAAQAIRKNVKKLQASSQEQILDAQTSSQQRQYQEFLQNQASSINRKKSSRHNDSEARSMTALAQSDGMSSQQSIRKYNKGQPQRSVSDFGVTHQNGPFSTTDLTGATFNQTSLEPFEINEDMPQRHNLANMFEKVDKRLNKTEMLISSQLSTNTSQNSSLYEEKATKSKFGASNSQVMTPLVTFEAHQNSVIGLQATSMVGNGQFASFSKDNSVKVWSLSTQKATELISNNRAANHNLPPKVTLKRQIKNQARPSQKLSSFQFMSVQNSPSQLASESRSLLLTGCTDKTLRLYDLSYSEQADAFDRRDTYGRKGGLSAADVMAPTLKLTGQHKGVISSIIQMPDSASENVQSYSDVFLTGCSDGAVRMFSLSMLSEGRDEPICTFDQGGSGVEQICAMTDNSFISSGHDKNIRLWDVRANDRQRLLEDANFGKVTWLQKYNSNIFASASNDGLVNFWDTRKMKLVKQVEIPSHGSICSIQFTKKRQYMIVAHDHKISVKNILANGENSQSSTSTAKSQQQSFTVCAHQEPAIPQSLKQTEPALSTENSWGNGAKLTSMIYNEADKKVYTGSFNKKITVWNLNFEAFN